MPTEPPAPDPATWSEEKFRALTQHSADIISLLDADGRLLYNSPAAERISGFSLAELAGISTFQLIHPDDRAAVEQAFRQVLSTPGASVAVQYRYRTKAGGWTWMEAVATNQLDNPMVRGLVANSRDISERKRAEEESARLEDTLRFRMTLLDYAAGHSLEELLRKTLDVVAALTSSPIGFYHFVEPDQKTLSLQAWSTRTTEEFCSAEGQGRHYPIDQAGVWVDCVHQKRAVIHNDYASLPHRKGLPPGHAAIARELVVPILRSGQIVAVVGVGNRPVDYTDQDVEIVSYLADIAWTIIERKRTEEALNKSEQRFRRIFDLIPSAVTLHNLDGTIRACNEPFCDASGYARAEVIGHSPLELGIWPDPERREAMWEALAREGHVENFEVGLRRKDGQLRQMQLSARFVELSGERALLVAARDVTEQRDLERQMLQSQKLESLGVLAGGIAHDFNNLLTGILGNADLARQEVSELGPAYASLEDIETAARRAADLCRQLLAYSGKGRFVVQPLHLEELVEEMGHLLTVSISKKVVLQRHFAEGIPAVEADATQLRQVIMNLIVNASEAIGERSGVISLTTGLMRCDAAYFAGCLTADGIAPGDFVYLEVADTGHGMDKATLDRIFDPFFSTKFAGRGLGLAAVLGIVRSHRGAIKVNSEPGRGTTFKLLFPACERSPEKPAARGALGVAWSGKGKVLIADDEETVRNLAQRVLERAGFTVITASDGREAVEKFAAGKDDIALIVLDLTMPHLDGEACYRELRRIEPEVKVILSSGYDEQNVVNRFAGTGLAGFVQKPYTPEELLAKVREVLGV